MNHKGLVTFDRSVKKDSFYLYKAWWSKEPFVHLCGRRYRNRAEQETEIKVYSNQPTVSLYQNGRLIETQQGDRVFRFRITLERENQIRAVSGTWEDEMTLIRTEHADPSYRLNKRKGRKSQNWV